MDVSAPLKLSPILGNLYQGGAADASVRQIEHDLWIVCMNAGEIDDTWIDHINVNGLTVVSILDVPLAVLPDDEVLAQLDMKIAWLMRGKPILGHCGAGVSRASYCNLPIIMRCKQMGYDDALALLRTVRPQAQPNSGFEAQLRRLEPQLKGFYPN